MTNRNKEVDLWFQKYEHPLKKEMLAVREILLSADKRMSECIKWSSPTFTYEGNLASFNPKTKKHISLMFHTGAKIPGDFPSLVGGGDTARYMTFESAKEVKEKKKELEKIVKAWCAEKEK
ncbi:MAG: DUF1801 domain-containing protein [Anaerolineae bacterium]|nr:DUF1801 domain-containing protein [Anaerolineae bacterium]MCI0608101.1 DUF1801 domain-containing protein [Anaerolineae bacterium]